MALARSVVAVAAMGLMAACAEMGTSDHSAKRDPFLDEMYPQGASSRTKGEATSKATQATSAGPAPESHGRAPTRPYLGLGGWLASGSMNANGLGINADISGGGLDAAGSVIGGVDFSVTDAVNVGLEVDYTAGEIGIGRLTADNVTGNAKLRHSWSVSVLPSISLDDQWRGFVRLGAGRASAQASVTDGVSTLSTDRSFTHVKAGIGLSRELSPNAAIRAEYVWMQTERRDYVQATVSGLQVSLLYGF